MDLAIRPRSVDLCPDCHNTFMGGVHGKRGKLANTPTCSLCRLMLAATSRLQALQFKPLRSYSVFFQRLIEPEDVEEKGSSGSPSAHFPLNLTVQASENEMAIKDGYTEFTRKALMDSAQSDDEALKYRTVAKPCRSAVLCTRLPVGAEERASLGGKDSKHLQMLAAASQVEQRIKYIAQTCAEQHEVCGKALSLTADGSNGKAFPYPIRLVHFQTSNGNHKARLVELEGDVPRYACVSHRWCGNEQWKTKRAEIGDAFKDIPFKSLPKTFQDAAIVAQSLGVNHLWVDSICIVQDDLTDWERQSKQMGLIFQRSSYALAAIDAFSNSEKDSGLLLARDAMPTEVTITSSFSAQYDRVLPPLASQTTNQGQDGDDQQDEFENLSSKAWRGLEYELNHVYTSFDMSVERSSWNSRGWIFQERLLSPRILYFTKEQVFWECAAGIVSESIKLDSDWAKGFRVEKDDQKVSNDAAHSGTSLHQLLRSQDHGPTEVTSKHSSVHPWSYTWKEHQSLRLWWRITERYSECILTFSKDRWFAIAGLCEILQSRYGAEIHAGIWEVGVGAGLLWHARNTPLRPFSDFAAPSWSWLNLDGPIGYAYDDNSYSACIQKVFPLIQRHAFEARTAPDSTGGPSHGFSEKLVLVCPTRWASVSSVKFGDFHFRETTGQTTAVPAWRYFQTASNGRSAVELAREYRSMGLPAMTRLLYSTAGDAKASNGKGGEASTDPPRAIGWAVLDRDSEPAGPVLCALILRRDLHGAKDVQQQVLECVLLVQNQDALGGEDNAVYRRIGRGRIVENGFLSDAKIDTVEMT